MCPIPGPIPVFFIGKGAGDVFILRKGCSSFYRCVVEKCLPDSLSAYNNIDCRFLFVVDLRFLGRNILRPALSFAPKSKIGKRQDYIFPVKIVYLHLSLLREKK